MLCVLTSVCVCVLIRDIKMYSFLFIKGYSYSNSFGG